ncbi:hypothetical protein SDC9_137186 [bioreactor metagenome]|uniref:Uncharacterized protein n=1 Tax=bioreactor metagenome TaxID=1076179 RepID=A0A645DKU8_9ZZZZ
MVEQIKEQLIIKYRLSREIHTKHNNIYEGEKITLIENTITGELKIKPRRR